MTHSSSFQSVAGKVVRPASPGWRAVIVLLAVWFLSLGRLTAADLPNILWIVAEDINPQLGCYGDTNAITPSIDRFATTALRYTKCWSTAPVCAPARTALITGVYPPSTGGEHMRSMVKMPEFMRMYPQLLRERGYYCVNNAKEDYNVEKPGAVWDASSKQAHWKNRKPGQPFFAAFNIELSHEGQIRSRTGPLQHDPSHMHLPAYHPDTPEVRRDWARYYDNITAMDAVVGKHLKELEQAGLAEDTIVFFYGDNGGGMPRSKRWPYNSGLQVPLLIHVPGNSSTWPRKITNPAPPRIGSWVSWISHPRCSPCGHRQRTGCRVTLSGPVRRRAAAIPFRLSRAHGRAVRPRPQRAQ